MKATRLTNLLRLIALLGGFSGLVFLSSCASYNTPEKRIAQRPGDFANLSKKHQELVRQGQIAKGMDSAAVSLAWGSPDRRSVGERDNQRFERWVYTRSRAQPVRRFGVFAGPAWGWGGWGGACWGRPMWWGTGIGNDIVWVPEEVGRVEFRNNKVDSWQVRQ